MIEKVIIRNFKSIKNLDLRLRNLNVLIGANGVGKSNFISFFEMTKALFEQRLGSYILGKGGVDNLLHKGRKISDSIYGLIDFDNTNAFFYNIKPSPSNRGYIDFTGDCFNVYHTTDKKYTTWNKTQWDSGVEESNIIHDISYRAKYLKKYLSGFVVYHFHDTSTTSPMRGQCDINDNEHLKDNGANLAAYLYKLQQTDIYAFRIIEQTISSVAPYFKRFKLRPDPLVANKISLEWEENESEMYLNGYSFSDGTIRFVALATLLLQSELPEVIIIDEPELGLHPVAINKLAAMIRMASKKSQIILSTQSTNLVNNFECEDVIVVDRSENQTVFNHLDKDALKVWLDEYEYTIADLWEKNIIGGQL